MDIKYSDILRIILRDESLELLIEALRLAKKVKDLIESNNKSLEKKKAS